MTPRRRICQCMCGGDEKDQEHGRSKYHRFAKCEMRNADDWNEMEPFDLADEGATVSFVKGTKESRRRRREGRQSEM